MPSDTLRFRCLLGLSRGGWEVPTEAQLTEASGGGGGEAEAHLDAVHPVNAVQHVLEEPAGPASSPALAPGPQQLLQVVPTGAGCCPAGRDALHTAGSSPAQLLG